MALISSFEKVLHVGGDDYLMFVFNPIYTVYGIRYFVSVFDNNNMHHVFSMTHKEGKWVITNPEIILNGLMILSKTCQKQYLKHP
jgi:hypothetical protein